MGIIYGTKGPDASNTSTMEEISTLYSYYPGDKVEFTRRFTVKDHSRGDRVRDLKVIKGTVVKDYPTYFTIRIHGVLGDYITTMHKVDLYLNQWDVKIDSFSKYMNPPEVNDEI